MGAEIEAQAAALEAVLAARQRRYGHQGLWLVLLGILWSGAFIIPFPVLTLVAFSFRRRAWVRGRRGELAYRTPFR